MLGASMTGEERGTVEEHRQRALAVKRIVRNKMALAGGAILLLSALSALLAPFLTPYDPIEMDLPSSLSAPSANHILGTDWYGRDVLSRTLFGGRVSLRVAVGSVAWAAVVGVTVGLVAGYLGGMGSNVLMRLMDALLGFPPILLAIAIRGSLGGGQPSVIFALGMVYVPVFARLVRGSTLSLKEDVFVMAAESYGASSVRIVFRHILPNLVGIIVVQATIAFSAAIIAEATLSFLGLGVPPPMPSWGRDLNDGRGYIRDAWWLVIVPSVTVVANVLGINFLGDGLRDALDPRMATRS
jgi:ABC-type dipeptide/oligopeptide/nickel transport system permease subunit